MNASAPPRRKDFLLFSLLATLCISAATYGVWKICGRPMYGTDDANIFFVYARNFVHGQGIVYNIGGEHVEGFTSTLYFLVCSLALFAFRQPEAALFVMNLLFAVFTSACLLYVLDQLADQLHLSRSGRFLLFGSYLLWIASNPAYFAWNIVTLMDSGIYSMLLTVGYALLASLLLRDAPATRRSAIALAALSSLCILSRPEGLGWAILLVCAFACIVWAQRRSARTTLPIAGIPFVVLLATYVALTGFREAYFGYPLPNTFYAKVSTPLATFHDGRLYFHLFLRSYGVAFLVPLVMGIAWIFYVLVRRQQTNKLFWFGVLTAIFSFVGLAIPVAEGGDHFGSFRMYQNVYPLLGLSLLLPLLPFVKSRRKSTWAMYILVVFLLVAGTSHVTWRSFREANQPFPVVPQHPVDTQLSMQVESTVANSQRLVGYSLDRIFEGGLPSIGVSAAGGEAYTYHGTIDDLLGLNDSKMAHADKIKVGFKDHASFNANVFYDRSPDILEPGTAPFGSPVDLEALRMQDLAPGSFHNAIFKGIFHEDRFRSIYTLALVYNPSYPSEMAFGYFRKPYLNALTLERGFVVLRRIDL